MLLNSTCGCLHCACQESATAARQLILKSDISMFKNVQAVPDLFMPTPACSASDVDPALVES